MHQFLTRRTLFRLAGGVGMAAAGLRLPRHQARAANAVSGKHLVTIGETAPAAEIVTWRVLDGEIDTAGSGLLARAAGFVAPVDGPGLLVTEAEGEPFEVLVDEAAFISEGRQQQYASLGPGSTRYLRIGLVAMKDADFPADGVLVTQPPYPEMTPLARVRLELYRVPIEFGEEWELPAGVGLALAMASGGSLKFASGEAEIALRSGQAQVLTAEGLDGTWIARCPRGTEQADLWLAIMADPDAPDPTEEAEPGDANEEAGETEATATPDEEPAEEGVVTVRVLRCATSNFDDTCIVRADGEELERYRLVLVGPVNEDRSLRADTIYYALTEDAEQLEDGGFVFTVPAGLYEFGSRGEGVFPTRLDDETYRGEPFDVSGEHVIELITPNN